MWKYFGRSGGTADILEIYRWPDNGVRLANQKLEDVQLLCPDGTWAPNRRQRVLKDLNDGWFNEEQDRLSPEQVDALFYKWQQNGWPGSEGQ